MPELRIIALNGLWVLGLSVILAAWSYARYAAYRERITTKIKLRELRYVVALDFGLFLFASGMAATESRVWGRIAWIVLCLVIIAHAALQIVAARSASPQN